VYQRCCRNASIANIVDPGSTGSTYEAKIPSISIASCNSSPSFNNFPPIVLCANDPLNFDHSATDIDGDSLAYALCAPASGASPMCPRPAGPFTGGPGCPSEPPAPPYDPVNYIASYTALYPLDAAPVMTIDAETGLLTGTPILPGQYVVGVCVQEYRDGVLLGNHIRDFQFNVAECEPLVVASIPDFILDCKDQTITVANMSTGADFYYWDFGDPGSTTDTSTAANPGPFTYSDTGSFIITLIANPGFVCADTAIANVSIFPTLLGGWDADITGCSGSPVFFTDTSSSTDAGTINDWNWVFGDGNTDTVPNPVYQYMNGGMFGVQLIVSTDKGCADTVFRFIDILPGPDAIFDFEDICQDQEALFNNLSTAPAGIVPIWDWELGDGTTSIDASPTHNYGAPGDYIIILTVSSDNGCVDEFIDTIKVGLVPLADGGPGGTVEFLDLYTLDGSGGGNYIWIPGINLDDPNAENPVFTAWETTIFVLEVISDDGCSDFDSVEVIVLPKEVLNVPSAFSPNGDGSNDKFLILWNDIAVLEEFSIYNRWGEQVFTTTSLTDGWDGTWKGADQDLGNYIYMINAVGSEGQRFERRGSVLLVR
ncbi:MAG: gliding motility-associated-like protein, partial [Limisphaerales bacterium]